MPTLPTLRPFALTFLFLTLIAGSRDAVAADYEKVVLVEVVNQGTQQRYDTVPVQFDATYAGPIQRALGTVPDKFDGWVSFALLPPKWEGSALARFGYFAPLTGLIDKDDARRLFALQVGAQVTVQGEFRVWNFPSIPASDLVPGFSAPPDNPYMLVDILWDPAAEI